MHLYINIYNIDKYKYYNIDNIYIFTYIFSYHFQGKDRRQRKFNHSSLTYHVPWGIHMKAHPFFSLAALSSPASHLLQDY